MTRDELFAHSERLGIPLVTVDKARAAISAAEAQNNGQGLAGLMLKHGRLDDMARDYLTKYLENFN